MVTIGIDASRANVLQRTGTEWYCFHLLKQFAKLYHPATTKVVLYVKDALVADLQDLPKDWEVRVLGWPPKLMWTQLRMSLEMLLPGRRPDVLFIPAHTIPVIHPKRTVYVAHDLGFEREAKLYANTYIGGRALHWLIKLFTLGRYGTTELDYHRWSMRYAVNHASQIVTISEFSKAELQHFYTVPDKRITVVHNGYDQAVYQPTDAVTQPPVPYFFYIGRIELKKNIPALIDAFAEFKQKTGLPHQLWLAGNPGFGADQAKANIAKHGLTKAVRWLGYVPEGDVPTLLQQATAFVFPTNYEGFGIPVIEALACGTPVVCSDIAPLREVGGSSCIYVDQQDVEALAAGLTQVAGWSSAQRSEHATRAQAQVQQFSWERCAAETWQVLEQAVH